MADRLKRELFDLAASLSRRGRSFVIATVVRRDGFTSAHQGDLAIIDDTGAFHGWVGGGCTRPTVEREAAATLASGKPRLIALSPDPERDPRPGVLALPMTCSSGGTVEIYLDPVIASPRLALFGRSPIISALAALARAIGYLVDVADPDAHVDEVPAADRVFTSIDAPELAGATFVIVGMMGELDEEAVIRGLALQPAYLGVIASRRRYALLRDALIARGIDVGALASIANPAGLDLGAREAGEVAVSILAQMVARRNGVAAVVERPASIEPATAAAGESRAASESPIPDDEPVAAASPHRPTSRRMTLPVIPVADAALEPTTATTETAIDPVCKMTVTIATAKHVAPWNGTSWYFCCGGCKTKFLANPTKFMAVSGGDGAAGGAR